MKSLAHTLVTFVLSFATVLGATPYDMTDGDYFESFTNIASWTDGFVSPTEATHWSSVAVNVTGTIPDGQRVMRASTNFTTTVNGGVQKDFTSGSRIALLSTGTVDNTNSVAIDLHLNFSGRAPGTLSFDWVSLTNSTGNRASSLRVYTSTNGTTFTELAVAAVLNKSNNVVESGSIGPIPLPVTFSNCPTARIRFYEYNGSGGNTGSRAKIGIDNVAVTSVLPSLVVTTNNNSGAGSLRQAIADALPGSTITFAPNLSGSTILLTSGQLFLNKNLTIDASALPGGITLNGNNASRIFLVNSSTTNVLLSLTLTGGNGTGTNASGSGGAIYNLGRLTLMGCTVSGNSAINGGGGIFSETASSRLLMTSSTVAGNTAAFGGGFLIRNSSVVSLVHCTVSGNTGTGGSGGVVLESSATLSLQNTIVAGNGDDIGGCGGTLTRSGNNIIGAQPFCYPAAAPIGAPNVNGDYVGTSVSPVNPLLSSLGNYGGSTRTMPPSQGSPAIDTALTLILSSDQRGFLRPADGNGNGASVADIGAVEFYQSPQLTTQPQSRTVLEGGAAVFSVAATGTALRYQWYSDGIPVLNATNSDLTISNAQVAWSGVACWVVITNYAGAVTSSVAVLTVASPINVAFKGNWPGYWGGAANDVQVEGVYAYVAADSGLLVLDVSNPDQPFQVGLYTTDSPAIRVVVTNGFAYLLTKSNEVVGAKCSRLDVHNPALPKKLKEYQASTPADVAVKGSYIYLADGYSLRVLNTNLQQVGSLTTANLNTGIIVIGNYLHLTQTDAFDGEMPIAICSISSPTSPVISGYTTAESAVTTSVGNLLYSSTRYTTTLDATDVSNPLAPIPKASYFNIFYGHSSAAGIEASGGLLYYFLHDKDVPHSFLEVFDISRPSNIVHTATFILPREYHPFRFRASAVGNRLYVAAESSGLMILNLSNAANPTLEGQFFSDVHAKDVVLQGNLAYVVDGDTGFHIVDVADPIEPIRLGTYRATNTAHVLSVKGRYAYLGVSATGYYSALEVIDVLDPANPVRVGLLEFAEGDTYDEFILRYSALQIEGDLAIMAKFGSTYITGDRAVLRVISLTNRLNPVLLGSYATNRWAEFTDVAVRSNYVYTARRAFTSYVSSDEDGIGVFNISIPTNPVQILQTTSSVAPTAITLNQNVCYLSGDGWTRMYDISQPANPVEIPGVALSNSLTLVSGNRAFGTDTQDGFNAFDVSNPATPVRIGQFTGITGKIKVEGRYAFIAGGDAGLTILDMGSSSATPPIIATQPGNGRTLTGGATNFFVTATGTVPLYYQWRFNGINIPGATWPLLLLTNIQFANAGEYSLFVSNAAGAAISSNGVLTVDFPAVVQLTAPGDSDIFWPSSNIVLTAAATDPDAPNGWVTQVQFFNGPTPLGISINPPPYTNTAFALVWSNVPAGSYSLKAVATDNEAATNTSAPVNIVVTNQPAFQLSQADYPVVESNGVVTVTVKRNLATNSASITLFTENATAFAAPPGGIGSYYALTNLLTFPAGVVSTNVRINLVNDLVNRGDRQFVVRLTSPDNGWALFNPSNAYVTIIDDDPLTNNFADVFIPPAGAAGAVRVTLSPGDAAGRWRFWWETDWRDSGSAVSNLAVGDFTLEFMPRSGYTAPSATTITISNATAFLSSTNYYTNIVGVAQTGRIGVALLPAEVATAANVTNRGQWRLTAGNTNWNDSSFVLTDISEGAHLVEFKSLPGYETPARQVMVVVAGQEVTYQATYTLPAAPVANGPVPLDSYATITNDAIQPGTPYRFSGQLFTDAGFSSGFVVKKRTVLTAAHAVFDIGRLAFATNVWWFFQRHRGDHEPLAQQPRGWHVFEGYAAARAGDPGPNESTVETRNLDVAALYFFEDAGRGGYGGYQITTTNGQWLDGAQLKLMVGYPVENVPEANRGKMHQVGPFFAAFQKVTNQVYRSDQIVSYGGNSGGPVCVLSTNSAGRAFFIPAGVYLGGSGETVARAIDLDVVDLINRAENSSSGGTNSTGGGVVPISRSPGSLLSHPAYLSVSVGPPAAVRAGAMWRISPTNYGELGELRFYTNFTASPLTLAVRSTSFSIQTIDLPGFQPPPGQPLVLPENSVQQLPLRYSVNPPWLTYHGASGLGITGTVGTAYRIETSSQIGGQSTWTTVTNSVTLNAGTNWIPNTAPAATSNRFYRAVWLQD